MNPQLQHDYPELARAIGALLGVCDGAVTQDGHGYNGMDAKFVRDVCDKSYCTIRMALALHKLLQKYTKQLIRFGIDYNAIPKPTPPATSSTTIAKPTKVLKLAVNPDAQVLLIEHGFDAKLNQLYHDLGFASWDGTIKKRCIKLSGSEVGAKARLVRCATFLKLAVDQYGYDIEAPEDVREMIRAAYREQQQKEKAAVEIQAVKTDFTVDLSSELTKAGIRLTPYPYQMAGIRVVDLSGGRCIIGDEMGLGKTMQAIAWSVWRKKKALVICPASLKINWFREVAKFSGASAHVLNGKPYFGADFTIINYEQLQKYEKELTEAAFDVVIIDESHYIKNGKAQRTKRTLKLAKKVKHVLLLTGTAIKSRPVEFYTQLNLLDPGQFRSFMWYGKRFCGGQHNGWGWDFKGSSNIEELVQLIAPIYVRRNKSEVLTELPPKVRQSIIINDLEARKLCDNIFDGVGEGESAFATTTNILQALTKARVEMSKLKGPLVVGWIENFLEQQEPDKKLLVFTNFYHHVDTILAHFGQQAVSITGRESGKDRQKSVDRFQEDESCRILVGTVGAAGVGLTLTAADTVLFCDLPWTPGELIQAEDRAHRIGQENTVVVYRLIYEGTIDGDMDTLIEDKAKLLQQILEGKKNPSGMESESIQSVLIQQIMERNKLSKQKGKKK